MNGGAVAPSIHVQTSGGGRFSVLPAVPLPRAALVFYNRCSYDVPRQYVEAVLKLQELAGQTFVVTIEPTKEQL